MNKNDELIKQIRIIQEVMDNYLIEECSIFGSRLKGTHTPFSDMDISVDATPILEIADEYRFLFDGYDSEHCARIILEETGETLARQLNMDVNIDVRFDYVEYDSSRLKPALKIIKKGVFLDEDELIKEIEHIRSLPISKEKINRSIFDQKHYLLILFSHYASCIRYFEYLKTTEDFLNPSTILQKAMRSDIIKSSSKLSGLVSKVEESLFVSNGLPYEELLKINKILKSKQLQANNFNTIDIGWNVCSELDLSDEEMSLFCNFYFNTQKHVAAWVLKVKELGPESDYYSPYHLYISSLEDKKGFENHFKDMYYENTEQHFKMPFLKIIEAVAY